MSEFALFCNHNKSSRCCQSVAHISRGNKREYLQPVRHGDHLDGLKAKAKEDRKSGCNAKDNSP